MPSLCTISGQFTDAHGHPVKGVVRFIPDRLWVVIDGIAWASLAPNEVLWDDGRFLVELTPTDSDECWWQYTVETPAGVYNISVPYRDEPYTLRELVYGRHSGPRP